MGKRLAVGLATTAVAAALAAGLWVFAPLFTDPGEPQLAMVWPPNGLAIPAISPPHPPPPPFACPCLYDFDDTAEDEDVGSVEPVPFLHLADASGGPPPVAKERVAAAKLSSLPSCSSLSRSARLK